jgi:phosphatidylethanolamine/phosphatidyl-N-methylethanolamine N-methyltransferase
MDIASIKNAYRRYAPGYNLCFGAVLHNGRKRVIEKMLCHPGDLVLEVGVGTGLSLPLYNRSARIVGIDLSPDMLKKARMLKEREKLDHVISLEEMNAELMSFRDDTFDKVAAMYVASVVPDPIRLVNEMRRVCKPGGEIFIVNHFLQANSFISTIERLISPLSGILGFHPDFPMDSFIYGTGLDVIEICPVNFLGYWTLIHARNNK